LTGDKVSTYGRKVAAEQIGNGFLWRNVAIYDQGFVKIGSRYEQLLGISGDTAGTGESQLGSLIKPLNVFSAVKGARLSLTIVTDKETHYFSPLQVSESDVRSYQKILGAGQAVLKQIEQRSMLGIKTDSTPADLGAQLKQVSELHAQGILSDDEFAAAKAKLLGS
jgi:hypothetical protein